MSHHMVIILQSAQVLSLSTHCFSSHPPGKLCHFSSSFYLNVSPYFCPFTFLPFFYFLLLEFLSDPSAFSVFSSFSCWTSLLSHLRFIFLPQLWMYMLCSRILVAPFLQYSCCVWSPASPLCCHSWIQRMSQLQSNTTPSRRLEIQQRYWWQL